LSSSFAEELNIEINFNSSAFAEEHNYKLASTTINECHHTTCGLSLLSSKQSDGQVPDSLSCKNYQFEA
jgi:hypothetical protein